MKGAAVVSLAVALGCSSEPTVPLGTISSEQAQQLILERDEARDAAAATAQRFEAEIAALRSEVAELRSQLGMAEETAEQAAVRAAQYEEGLGKAVERLNQVSQEATNAQRLVAANHAAAETYRQAARTQREPSADLSYFTAPRLSIVENSIMASGRFYNSGDGPARGVLYLDLVRNGEVIDTAEQRILANQKSWGTWQQEFHATPSGAQVTVVPRFEAE